MKIFNLFRVHIQRSKTHNSNMGFALIETLVAITILIGGIAGPMTIASRSIAAAQHAKNQLIASFLAEEGIEYVRNVRDTNSIVGVAWLSGLSECVGGSCTVDSPTVTVDGCSGTCAVVRFDATSGRYGYDANWDTTSFVRSVEITEITANQEVKVSTTVTWQQGRVNRSLVVEERLFNWKQ